MADVLFSPSLISPQVQRDIKKGFVVRPLASSDYDKGFLTLLSMLTVVGPTTKKTFMDRFNYFKTHNDQYFTIVIEDSASKKIVGAGTLLVERKFIHLNGLVGHIEDIVTHTDYRGANLGKMVIETLKYVGEQVGCYKIILDCSEKNVPFYVKCGFTQKEVEMAYYINRNDKAKL